MRGNGLFKQITLGVILAAVLLPTPARAQWTVFDPANYKIQIKKQIDDLSRWLQTVNQYMTMYENAVGQLTNLKGILRTADEMLAHDKTRRGDLQGRGRAQPLRPHSHHDEQSLAWRYRGHDQTEGEVAKWQISGEKELSHGLAPARLSSL